tara:strand:- start:1962 stop:2222 length:261 start_codon:yes stop_codon:yes gene_type:complete
MYIKKGIYSSVDALFIGTGMKVSNWDNGLTAEQQAEMDAKWEELLAQVKKIDPKLYKKIQDESLEYFLTDDEPVVVTENNQYQLNL